MSPCAWCPFDCPSPEVALCADGEGAEAPVTPPPRRVRYRPLRRLENVIRDIADYQEGTTS